MQYAMVDGSRVEAFPSGKGTCPICEAPAVAKCGERVMHHWAHARDRLCDPWWENETPWHRDWKAHFPADCREVAHVAGDDEVHRADVKTPTGIIVEIQNSPISDTERKSREAFYGNMIWIVNGARFKERFHILHALPDPESELAKDIVWFRARHNQARGLFWRRSLNPDQVPGAGGMVLIHGIDRIDAEVVALSRGHFQYDWVRAHAGWLESGCPVYLDFGDDWLWRLERYGDYGLPCVYAVGRRKLVYDLMIERRSEDLATRFYPLQPG
jgi:hypothetical protein